MGRKPLIEERKHPLYFKMQSLRNPDLSSDGNGVGEAAQTTKSPEWLMEQVMEGLSDACMLVDGTGRLLYVNTVAKALLSAKGRLLGRKLETVLAHRQLSMLAADVYHTGKPVFTRLDIALPGDRWREGRSFHVSLVPLWITPLRRLMRIALRDAAREVPAPTVSGAGGCEETPQPAPQPQCTDAMSRMRNPLTILQGYLENLLDGAIKDPILLRQTLLTMRKHTITLEKLMESCGK